MNLVLTPTLTFNDCIALGIKNFGLEVTKAAESAAKEFTIEETLTKMQKEWESIEMELTLYKSTGTYIMKVADEVMQMLDDHIVITQQISFSPFKGPFEKAIDDWQEKLRLTADVIEEWIDVQRHECLCKWELFQNFSLQTVDVFRTNLY